MLKVEIKWMHAYWKQNAEKLRFSPRDWPSERWQEGLYPAVRGLKTLLWGIWPVKKEKKPKDSDYWELPNKWPTQFTRLVKSTATSPTYTVRVSNQLFRSSWTISRQQRIIRQLWRACKMLDSKTTKENKNLKKRRLQKEKAKPPKKPLIKIL